jgi:hypothetical protein
MNTCQHCRHSQLVRAQPTDLDGQLVCRRFPPVPSVAIIPSEGLDGRPRFTPSSFTAVPNVGKDDWCGEFEQA